MNEINDTSEDSLYRRRIPTGHASFDELYVKFFGNIPEEQNLLIYQNESFESLHQQYYPNNENTEMIKRQCMFDDLYSKFADKFQTFDEEKCSPDFIYTLVDNASNDTNQKCEFTSFPQTRSSITSPHKQTFKNIKIIKRK
ncbi:11328_t:CDS:2 [Funneliformis geosporum]|uniref:3050_t:CDS:1 n=1 Tax=Funneliformis geosporum TaxID=1117311 RepID=A0A9W4SX12_9GLOM|nr:3050_t:CDS:2 [Funneliformis geosporum]CAI2186799.1 11328_t:CDS:2 [Funneliformis geosporum]